MADLLIRNGYILTMDPKLKDIPNGILAIDKGKISDVSESATLSADKTIDATGCVVMPGLINTHCHLAMTLLRGYADDVALQTWLEDRIWPIEAKLTKEDVRAGSRLGCLEMIRNGTTAFADMYFHMDETARAVEESGLRALLCHGMIELEDPRRAESELAEGTRFARMWKDTPNGRISATYGPHAPNTCSPDFLCAVMDRALQDGTGIQIHILEGKAERDDMPDEYDGSVIEFLNGRYDEWPQVLAAHCVWLNDKEISILAKRKVSVAHNAVCNMKLASGIAPVAEMLKQGVNVSLATDGCASNNSLDMFEEMKIAALLQKINTGDPSVLPARQVLEMATVNGARALGIDSGALRPGANADLIIVDLNQPHLTPCHDVASHLVYAARGSDVVTTIVGGSVLMENRKVLSLDEAAVIEESRRSAKSLLERRNR